MRDVPSPHKLFESRFAKMRIAIASDRAGYEEKERLKPLLNELGIAFEDLGTGSEESVDYSDYARKVGEEVAKGNVDQCAPGLPPGSPAAGTQRRVEKIRELEQEELAQHAQH
jgi:hypothetical protein